MAIISIKHYINHAGGEETLRDVVALLVEKVGEYAVAGDPREFEAFRAEMRAVHDALTPELPPENLWNLAGSATQTLEAYNTRITKTIGSQGSEFQKIVRMLQQSLVKIAGENAEFVQGLGRIGEDLERCAGFKDLESLKLHLGTCLSGFREEIEREKTASKALIEKLQCEIESIRDNGKKPIEKKVDPAGAPQKWRATSLLPREDCIAAIQRAIDSGTRHYLLVMVVNRVEPINARFGREAGDRMLTRFEEYLETQLLAADRVFRWTGPSMVALLERPQAFEHVRFIAKRMLDTTIDETIDLAGRSVLIPISTAWSVFALGSTAEAAEKQIQTFITGHGCRDFV